MRLMLAALVATSVIAIVAAVFAIWPVVADAPWEDDAQAARDAARCETALELTDSATQVHLQLIGPDAEAGIEWFTYLEDVMNRYCPKGLSY